MTKLTEDQYMELADCLKSFIATKQKGFKDGMDIILEGGDVDDVMVEVGEEIVIRQLEEVLKKIGIK